MVADLEARLPGEVSLRKGEPVQVLSSADGWSTVLRRDGQRGTCPDSFLRSPDESCGPAADVVPVDNSWLAPSEPHCRALFSFELVFRIRRFNRAF